MTAAVHDTFVLERDFAKPPANVFAAFADPAKMRRWHAEHPSHEVLDFTTDFRIGGADHWRLRMGPTTPIAGRVMSYDGVHLDIVPDRRIVTAHTMALEAKVFSASLVTFDLFARGGGTQLVLIHQGVFFEGSDGPKMRQQGWASLIERLATEVAR